MLSPRTSQILAWSVAIASLALWVTATPATWGQVLRGQDSSPAAAAAPDAPTDPSDGSGSTPCLPIPPIVQTMPPSADTTQPPVPSIPTAQDGTFHLCGADPQVERAIEQLVAGRGFNASLISRNDGCADLTIRVNGQGTAGSASSRLSVGLGSGRTLSVQIVSQGGATHASIGGA